MASPRGKQSASPELEAIEALKPDVEERPLKKQRLSWRPEHIYDPPQPPTAEERALEESRLQQAALIGQEARGRARIRPRRTVDYFASLERWRLYKTFYTSPYDIEHLRPQPDYVIELLPAAAYPNNSSTSICSRYVHTSTNKIRHPINVVRWTPDGRRLLTGATSGEFTLWNGLTFNFETILTAHDYAVRGVDWSSSGVWLVSGDNAGFIKYFQINMNNLQAFKGHEEPIRDVSFAPNDARFVTGSDDKTIKIWSFERMEEERTLNGHLWDVKCVKWHQSKGLLVSGGKDSLIKFWDPRTGKALLTLQEYHKNTVQAVEWSPNGHCVASVSRDSFVKVFDIRAMKELQTLRGHKKEVCSVAWHPIHHDYLASGGADGSIIHWNLGSSAPVDNLEFAHESNVWSLAFHPVGHLLASGSNDYCTRFWSRSRPAGRLLNDRFHVGREKARELGSREEDDQEEDFALPGLQQGPPPPPMGNGYASGGYGRSGGGGGYIPGFGGGSATSQSGPYSRPRNF